MSPWGCPDRRDHGQLPARHRQDDRDRRVKDLVVVETADAVLVASRGRVQEVKRIVNRLKAQGRPEANLHRRVVRPWVPTRAFPWRTLSS